MVPPRPTSILRAEHELMLVVLACLDRLVRDEQLVADNFQRRALRILKFLSGFGEASHHGKEEHQLAPVLLRLGFSQNEGLLAHLHGERSRGRRELVLLERELEACAAGDQRARERFAVQATSYSYHLRGQLELEEQELFTAVEQTLSAEQEQQILRSFMQFERERIGAGTTERQLGAARELCAGFELPFPEEAAITLSFWRKSLQRA